MGQPATVGRARQMLGRLSVTDAPWAMVGDDVVTQLRRVVGFDCFCLVQNGTWGERIGEPGAGAFNVC